MFKIGTRVVISDPALRGIKGIKKMAEGTVQQVLKNRRNDPKLPAHYYLVVMDDGKTCYPDSKQIAEVTW